MKKKMKTPLEVFAAPTTTGQLVKAWRKNFEIPQEEMAFACGISQANLSAIENDRREVGQSGIAPGLVYGARSRHHPLPQWIRLRAGVPRSSKAEREDQRARGLIAANVGYAQAFLSALSCALRLGIFPLCTRP